MRQEVILSERTCSADLRSWFVVSGGPPLYGTQPRLRVTCFLLASQMPPCRQNELRLKSPFRTSLHAIELRPCLRLLPLSLPFSHCFSLPHTAPAGATRRPRCSRRWCSARRCRRATKRATAKKRPDADDDADDSPPSGRAAATSGHSPPEASRSRQPVAEPKLPPVRVDPTLLPVDAYLGVPPKQFVL